MTDIEFDDLMGAMLRENKQRVVNSLMAGNDVGCFTTEQYAQRYAQICWPNDREFCLKLLHSCLDSNGKEMLAHKHLRTYPRMVEVKPDVWAERSTVGLPRVPGPPNPPRPERPREVG